MRLAYIYRIYFYDLFAGTLIIYRFFNLWLSDVVIVTRLDPEDYTKLTKALTFTDTITSIPVSIDIEDDLVFEPTEHFNISLSTSSDGCAISPGNEIIPVYIMDNGEIMLSAHCTYQVKV